MGFCLAAIISSLLPELPTAVLTCHKQQKTIVDEDPNDTTGNDDEDKNEHANDNDDKYSKTK